MNISVKCHQGKGQRREAVMRRRECPPRSRPEVDELSCISETQQSQQAAGVEELVVGVKDPLEMSDKEQGDMGLRHSRIHIQVIRTHRTRRLQGYTGCWGSPKGKGKGKSKTKEGQDITEEMADKRSKKPAVLFAAEEEQKLVTFCRIMKFSTTSV